MEGISTIVYQGKCIYFIEFSHAKSQDETLFLIHAAGDEFEKNPKNSILALFDITHAFFHLETLKTFKKLDKRCGSYEKKVAIIGLKGLKKAGFRSMNQNPNVQPFDTAQEAKDWLVAD